MVLCLCQQLKTQIMSEQILSLCPLDQTDDLHPVWDPWFFFPIWKPSKMFTGSDSAIIIKEEDLGNLSCHKCEENFKQQWDPYTVCQIQPNNTPLIPCLRTETYCMVSPAKTLITDKYLGVRIPIPSFPWNLQSYQIDIVNPQEI